MNARYISVKYGPWLNNVLFFSLVVCDSYMIAFFITATHNELLNNLQAVLTFNR